MDEKQAFRQFLRGAGYTEHDIDAALHEAVALSQQFDLDIIVIAHMVSEGVDKGDLPHDATHSQVVDHIALALQSYHPDLE